MKMKFLILQLVIALAICFCAGTMVMADEPQPLINNVFSDTFILEALRDISTQAKVAIIADSSVTGYVNLTLENTSLEKALTLVLAPGGYVYRKLDDFYLVGSSDIKSASFSALTKAQAVKLKYARAESLANLIPESFKAFVKFDKDTNTAFISAPEPLHSRILEHLIELDRAPAQVMIEALVIELTKEGRQQLGMDWSWNGVDGPGNPGIPGSGSIDNVNNSLNFVIYSKGGLGEKILSIKALAEKGSAKIQANPRVCTLDGRPAEIEIGKDSYYEITTTNQDNNTTTTTHTLETIKTGIKLHFVPYVAEGGEITMLIEPEVSNIADGGGGKTLPVINRRHVSTTVKVKTGETIILGGLLQQTQEKTQIKVPILGDIPLLGFLFKKEVKVDGESEILIMVTPYLMQGPSDGLESQLKPPPSMNK